MPPMDPNAGMPPMDPNAEMLPMDPNAGMPPMEPNAGNAYDTNFDAGVEADEEQDPKKYIQQLTGKLSQSLRSYNETLPQPDVDLAKYVAGMIIKQAIEGLSPEDTNDILNKVKADDTETNDTETSSVGGAPENDEMPPTEQPMGNEPPQQNGMMEHFNRRFHNHKQHLGEVLTNQLNTSQYHTAQRIDGSGYSKSPYVGRRFK